METKITVLILTSLGVIVLLLLLVKFLNLIQILKSNAKLNKALVLKIIENHFKEGLINPFSSSSEVKIKFFTQSSNSVIGQIKFLSGDIIFNGFQKTFFSYTKQLFAF